MSTATGPTLSELSFLGLVAECPEGTVRDPVTGQCVREGGFDSGRGEFGDPIDVGGVGVEVPQETDDASPQTEPERAGLPVGLLLALAALLAVIIHQG